MARRAALESLPGGPAVLQQPLRLGVVIRSVEPAFRGEPELLVAAPAEKLGVVTRRALRLAAPGIRGVPLREVCCVEASLVLAGVAVRTELLLVTS
jgi:hypothetical protein